MYGKKTMIGKRKKLDVNKDGKISGEDFKMLRKKKTLMNKGK
jgi:hypothetical protein|tara:strand:- start:375 stop:500 length:126 start_codon:yes stop_codon:yes gene_type:complete